MSPSLMTYTVVSAPAVTMDASDKVTHKLPGSSEVLKNTVMYGQGGDQLLLEDLPTLNHQVLELAFPS